MTLDAPPVCALCLRRCADPVACEGRTFCRSCVRALGEFASQPRWRARAWKDPGPRDADALTRSLTPRADLASFHQEIAELAKGWRSTGEVFVEITEGNAALVAPDDAETHLDLAVAYREMSLREDALVEVAVALHHSERLTPTRASQAVRLLLDPRWLRLSVDELLTLIRAEHFAN